MRRLRRAHQRHAEKRKKLRSRAIAAGTAAAITLGTGVSLRKALAAHTPDPHELPVSQDADADLLANLEELAIGYPVFDPDQNGDTIPDGVELAKSCAAAIDKLPWKDEVTDPNQTYKWRTPTYGEEICDICGAKVNMGPAGIVNPRLGLSVDCPLICMHYMEHGSFSYGGHTYGGEPMHVGRINVPLLMLALELPYEPDRHQLPVPKDADTDLLANPEELAIGYQPFERDQNRNEIPDGIELAIRCAAVVAQLPEYHPHPASDPPPDETYKIGHLLDGFERCDACLKDIHMGGWEIINPRLGLKYPDPNDPLDGTFLPDLALHYMEHGSFDCYGHDHNDHKGRVNIPRLLRVLELRYPHDPNEHQLPLDYVVSPTEQLAPDANDLDGDLLADSEELAAGFNLYDPDQDNDLTADGIEFAIQCADAIDQLPVHDLYGGEPEPEGPYKVSYFQKGLERCEICGASVNMGWWQVVNPKLHRSMDIYDITCHYMSHGSFSYSGLHLELPHEPFHNGRVKIELLAEILEMPQRCGDLGTMYLPTDYNRDCTEDFRDFAGFADKWLESTDPNQD